MNESVFKEILGEALKSGLEEFDNAPEHMFSLKHRLAMKRIFAKYDRNVRKLKETNAENFVIEYEPRLNIRQRIIFITIVIILMIFLVGCVTVLVSDMYVRTYQHSLEDDKKDLYATMRPWMNTNYLQVPVAGDLKELMNSIEKGLADGKSLRDILQNRIDRYAEECGEEGVVAVGSSQADIILIDPDTGKVIDSHPKGRCIVFSKKIQDMDYDTVRSQADDLATFLRYAVFKKETDDPEKVSALISELKEKQSDYDTSRFLPIFYSGGEQGEKNVEYWGKLLGTDGLNWDSLSEDERDEIVDELMRILAERYSSNDRTDEGLLEEMGKMKSASAAAKNERCDLAEFGLMAN
ncbi:MAG: hypothetical protein K2N38_05515 [Oscillospiraceae bacterium]|nr:hypothetical protein [Oscillospiraceae bacterium]